MKYCVTIFTPLIKKERYRNKGCTIEQLTPSFFHTIKFHCNNSGIEFREDDTKLNRYQFVINKHNLPLSILQLLTISKSFFNFMQTNISRE